MARQAPLAGTGTRGGDTIKREAQGNNETSIPAFSGHVQPDISFSGLGNEMHVAYASYWISPGSYWVHDRVLHGTSADSRLQVQHAGDDGIEEPAVAGSQNGRCLVVWREEYTVDDWDIFGQRVSPYRVFLPIALREY